MKITDKIIERLILYRRFVQSLEQENKNFIFSHEIASLTGFTSAQVRRDIMAIGYSGSPVYGYNCEDLIKSISEFVESPTKQFVALVGVGHLGRAILDYLQGQKPNLEIIAAFDNDSSKVDRIIHGCKVYHVNNMEEIIKLNNVKISILAIPAQSAQEIAEKLVDAGIKSIVNYTPTKLRLNPEIYIENRDMMIAIEKAAYFARQT